MVVRWHYNGGAVIMGAGDRFRFPAPSRQKTSIFRARSRAKNVLLPNPHPNSALARSRKIEIKCEKYPEYSAKIFSHQPPTARNPKPRMPDRLRPTFCHAPKSSQSLSLTGPFVQPIYPCTKSLLTWSLTRYKHPLVHLDHRLLTALQTLQIAVTTLTYSLTRPR